MSNRRTIILAALAASVLAGVLPMAAADSVAGDLAPRVADGAPVRDAGTALRDIRVEAGTDGGPAVTLLADGPLDYASEVLTGPDRLVLDLKGVTARLQASQVAVGRGGVERVRAGQYRVDPIPTSRVVFDLEGPRPFRIDRRDDGITVVFGEAAPAAAADAAAAVPSSAAHDGPAEARAIAPDALESLLRTPPMAALADPPAAAAGDESAPAGSFETKTIVTDATRYSGKKISLNLVDADVKQVFRLFHEISGLNFVLDPGVEGRVTIVLDNVPWDQALDIILNNNGLDKALENNVIRIATTQKLALEAASRRQLKEAKELEVEPITITRTLSYAKAKEVERVIRDGGVLSPRGKVIVDERTNTLIISDIPKKVEPLDELISTLDSETPQVMIEARIVETSRDVRPGLRGQVGLERDRRRIPRHRDESGVSAQRVGQVRPEPAGQQRGEQPRLQVRERHRLLHARRHPERARDGRARTDSLLAEDRDPEQRAGGDRTGRPDPDREHDGHGDQRGVRLGVAAPGGDPADHSRGDDHPRHPGGEQLAGLREPRGHDAAHQHTARADEGAHLGRRYHGDRRDLQRQRVPQRVGRAVVPEAAGVRLAVQGDGTSRTRTGSS